MSAQTPREIPHNAVTLDQQNGKIGGIAHDPYRCRNTGRLLQDHLVHDRDMGTVRHFRSWFSDLSCSAHT